jgi:hypothetical protein
MRKTDSRRGAEAQRKQKLFPSAPQRLCGISIFQTPELSFFYATFHFPKPDEVPD